MDQMVQIKGQFHCCTNLLYHTGLLDLSIFHPVSRCFGLLLDSDPQFVAMLFAQIESQSGGMLHLPSVLSGKSCFKDSREVCGINPDAVVLN